MASNPRVFKALEAMRALGISDEEVKPVLKRLLKLYDKNWELIEEDNYRTLVDAYFELKENSKHDDGIERSTKIPHLEEKNDEKKALKISGQGIVMEQSEPCLSEGRIVGSSERPRTHFMDKGKGPISSHVVDRKSVSERSLSAHVRRKHMPSSQCNVQRENMKSNHHKKMLIQKPIVSPPPVPTRSSNDSTPHHSVMALASHSLHSCDKDDNSPCNDSTSTGNNFDIASSCSGEVKILLNCDSALGQLNFHTPNFDAVLRFVEDKYFRSYKIKGPQFSVRKLLKDLCESYLKLGTDSPDRSVVANPSNCGINISDTMHVSGSKKRAIEIQNFEAYSNQKSSDCSGHTNSYNSFPDEMNHFHGFPDITKGAEKVEISLVHEFCKESLPKFNYIPHNIIYQNGNVNISLARISDEDCCSGCSGDCLSSSIPCACARETGGEFAYTTQGRLKGDFLSACMSLKREPQEHHFVYCQDCPLERTQNEYMPERCKGHLVKKFIKECWRKCGCDMRCGNRIVQRGITCKLQVFLTPEGKGWGVRTLEDLPKGTFVCEYVGEVLTNMELYERILQSSGNERHTYPVTLDADWGSEGILRDEEALCLDATCHGNVARFINHRCFDANLVDIPVEVETPDRHYYHIAFFTTSKVTAFQELTWDYGIDFADKNHPIKAFSCHCGSSSCRDMKRKRR
ncbi:hypothetical protein I3760_07G073800 [Carya illinoinensis]|nr:hypothetical protein I3760_07G073800 [Carya illinoinensis]